MAKLGGYQITEKDIDGVIRYLKIIDPENATPEMAIELLEHLKASVHIMAHENPEKLKKIYEDLKNKRSSRAKRTKPSRISPQVPLVSFLA